MQKLLNTTFVAVSYRIWSRLLSTGKNGLLSCLAFLLLIGLPTSVKASGFYKNFVIINGTYYYTNSPGANNPNPISFDGQYFGSFDRGTGSLTLGAEANTYSDNNDDVQPPQLFYRIYLENTTPPEDFTPLNLGFVASGNDGPNNKKWDNTSARINLVTTANTEGTYVLEVFFRSRQNYNRGDFLYDSKFGSNYKGYFTVTGAPVVWNGTQGSNWNNTANWVGGKLPDRNTDVIIPSDVATPPIITDGVVARARTLTVNPKPGLPGATVLSQTGGELQVYGNFNDTGGGFKQTPGSNSIITLAGTNSQAFDGGNFVNVRIQGGSDKYLRNAVSISNSLTFISGKLYTLTDNPALFNVDLGSNATISNESEVSYVLGVLRSNRDVPQNQFIDFGNIGFDLLATAGSPGNTIVTRITGPNDFAYSGVGTSKSIRRGFIVQPTNKETLTFKLTFHYLDAELRDIPESNLLLFRSTTGSIPFEGLTLESSDQFDNTLTSTDITGNLTSTFTLGNSANPLPVTLVSFTATPTTQGAALLRWTTATETNNKGFGIERQLAHGDTWQSVGYLASGNNATGGTYEYTDKSLVNATSTPQAYYRLRQEDQDGKVSYSPVAVVARQAAVVSTELLLSPVPVTGSNISLTFAEASQAGSEISIINTQGQRLYSQITQASGNAALSLPVEHLAAGVYIVSVRVPGQAVRHARFVKL
jgi:hypothetical protein